MNRGFSIPLRNRRFDGCSERAGPAEVGKSVPDLPMCSTFVSTTGGVMTGEVGAITGELELLTRPTALPSRQ